MGSSYTYAHTSLIATLKQRKKPKKGEATLTHEHGKPCTLKHKAQSPSAALHTHTRKQHSHSQEIAHAAVLLRALIITITSQQMRVRSSVASMFGGDEGGMVVPHHLVRIGH